MIWDTVTSRKKKIKIQVTSPEHVVSLFTKKERSAQQEMFWLVTVDGKQEVTGRFLISIGSLNNTMVHPREIMYHCVTSHAAAFFVAHNHPSGRLTPSDNDIDVAKRLLEVGKLLGIQFLDSIILTKDSYVSFKGKGIIE